MQLSAVHWNQDEDYGGFGGPHCMVLGGYGAVTDALGRMLKGLRLSTPVAQVEDTESGVRVTTASGAEFSVADNPAKLSKQTELATKWLVRDSLIPQTIESIERGRLQLDTRDFRCAPAAGEVFEGDSAIVAVPLGCLKADAVAFAPPLPGWKRDAIAALGNGNLNKVPFCLNNQYIISGNRAHSCALTTWPTLMRQITASR